MTELNTEFGLLSRIEKHLRELAPHMMQREGVLLLREAAKEISRLQEGFSRCYIICKGKNCSAINGQGHSEDCDREHEQCMKNC